MLARAAARPVRQVAPLLRRRSAGQSRPETVEAVSQSWWHCGRAATWRAITMGDGNLGSRTQTAIGPRLSTPGLGPGAHHAMVCFIARQSSLQGLPSPRLITAPSSIRVIVAPSPLGRELPSTLVPQHPKPESARPCPTRRGEAESAAAMRQRGEPLTAVCLPADARLVCGELMTTLRPWCENQEQPDQALQHPSKL